jgi:hypothetical protein
MVTINQLLNALTTAAENHRQIRTSVVSVDPDLNTSGETSYPLMRIFPDGSQVAVDKVIFRFAVAVMDIHRQDFTDAVERLSDTHQILLDIYSTLRYIYRNDSAGNWVVNDTATPFYDDKTDVVAGHAMVFEFHAPNTRDFCEVPSNDYDFPGLDLSGLRVIDNGYYNSSFSNTINGGIA